MCYSLNTAYYFFGHEARTALGQEEETGLVTGLGKYILEYAPYAASMPQGRVHLILLRNLMD